MECPEFVAAGPCNPCYPGPVFYGHNTKVAWTMTHAQGDRFDVYREKVRVRKQQDEEEQHEGEETLERLREHNREIARVESDICMGDLEASSEHDGNSEDLEEGDDELEEATNEGEEKDEDKITWERFLHGGARKTLEEEEFSRALTLGERLRLRKRLPIVEGP